LPLERVRHARRASVEAMIRTGTNAVLTSSAGRLFDAVSSLAGICHEASYEGQAAVELEAVSVVAGEEPYPLTLAAGELLEIDARPLVAAVLDDVERGVSPAAIGGRLHLALAEALVELCRRVRDEHRLEAVALSGGCFQSRLLTTLVSDGLARAGFEVLLHARVPPNDGGIALGQAAVAGWQCLTGRRP
jgi:hydrogenase maturation protein HypF